MGKLSRRATSVAATTPKGLPPRPLQEHRQQGACCEPASARTQNMRRTIRRQSQAPRLVVGRCPQCAAPLGCQAPARCQARASGSREHGCQMRCQDGSRRRGDWRLAGAAVRPPVIAAASARSASPHPGQRARRPRRGSSDWVATPRGSSSRPSSLPLRWRQAQGRSLTIPLRAPLWTCQPAQHTTAPPLRPCPQDPVSLPPPSSSSAAVARSRAQAAPRPARQATTPNRRGLRPRPAAAPPLGRAAAAVPAASATMTSRLFPARLRRPVTPQSGTEPTEPTTRPPMLPTQGCRSQARSSGRPPPPRTAAEPPTPAARSV